MELIYVPAANNLPFLRSTERGSVSAHVVRRLGTLRDALSLRRPKGRSNGIHVGRKVGVARRAPYGSYLHMTLPEVGDLGLCSYHGQHVSNGREGIQNGWTSCLPTPGSV